MYLNECINVPHSRNVLRDERLELGVEVDGLRGVAHDVGEQVLDLAVHIQVLVLGGVVPNKCFLVFTSLRHEFEHNIYIVDNRQVVTQVI